MNVHPIASLFLPMTERELQELKADIEQHGLREAIWTFEGQILDGRHRWEACRQLGIAPSTRPYEGDEPLAFVISMNLKRRHLSEAQRSIIAAKIANLPHGGDRRSDQAANLPLETQAHAAEMLNVSERSVRSAKDVLKKGVPELVAAVEQGHVSVSTAEQISKFPQETQRQVVEQGPEAIRSTTKKQREKTGGKPAAAAAGRSGETETEAENARLRAANAALENEIRELQNNLSELSIEVESMHALRANEHFDTLKALRMDVRALKQRRNDLMNENGQLRREVTYWRGRAEQAENGIKREVA